ncbi:MAG: sugar phosphate nucleotidyltransferase, partial [Promethearchaeota archaeon]
MKVIILNAGIGKRFGDLTKNKPKCLIKITKKETILDLQLKTLIECNFIDIVMLTGPFEDMIKNHVNENYPILNVQY